MLSTSTMNPIIKDITTSETSEIDEYLQLINVSNIPIPNTEELEFSHGFTRKIYRIVANVFENNSLLIKFDYNIHYKLYIRIVTKLKASKAIKKWEILVDKLREEKINIPVFIDWIGETDLKPEELGYEIGFILAKMNIGLTTELALDVSRIIESLRD